VSYASELIEALVHHVGPPAVLVGHSFGGVVALAVALRDKIPVKALALFEPVALKILTSGGDAEVYAAAKAALDDYIASFERGDDGAIQKMVDFWFGKGAFDKMPEPLTTYLIRETASNIKDVRATYRERYAMGALEKLRMPVAIVVGDRSPKVTHRIARALAERVAYGSFTKLENATHALTTTHADAVAEIIERVASMALHRPG
jgi:pimeloyl-ACP methyl ester carboxylesterase